MRRLSLLLSAFVIGGLILSGCAPAAAPTPKPTAPTIEPTAKPAVATPVAKPAAPTPTSKPAATGPRSGGILKTSHKFDIPSYDIHQEASAATLWPVAPAYNGLLQYDPTNKEKIIGDLAEKWEVSPDGKVYTFNLNKGVKWHDGVAFSSADVKYSIDRMRNPPQGTRSARQTSYRAVDSVETPDANTVKITLKYPSASFVPTALAPTWFAIMPKHVIEAKGDMKREILGTGPFKFKSFAGETVFDMVRNADYFAKGRPYLDGLTRYIIKEEATRFAAFRTKRLDITLPDGLTPAFADTVKKEMPEATIFVHEAGNWTTIYMNNSRAPWNDVRVRRAVSLSVDRQKGIDVIEQGVGMVGTQQTPKTVYAMADADLLKLPGYRQPKDADRAEAKRLLAEAGFPDGFKTDILYRTGSAYETAAVFVADQLKTIGITTTLEAKETASMFDSVSKKLHNIFLYKDTYGTPDPDDLLAAFYQSNSPKNYSIFSDTQLDDFFDQQSKALDVDKRKAVVLQAQQRMLELVPSAVVYWGSYRGAYWPQVKDYVPGVSTTNNIRYEVVWLAQ